MLIALVLVCSVLVTPDLTQCGERNAVDVLVVPGEESNPAMCFMHGQAYIAETALGHFGADERLKVICHPRKP